jgi:hypothetical protein
MIFEELEGTAFTLTDRNFEINKLKQLRKVKKKATYF